MKNQVSWQPAGAMIEEFLRTITEEQLIKTRVLNLEKNVAELEAEIKLMREEKNRE